MGVLGAGQDAQPPYGGATFNGQTFETSVAQPLPKVPAITWDLRSELDKHKDDPVFRLQFEAANQEHEAEKDDADRKRVIAGSHLPGVLGDMEKQQAFDKQLRGQIEEARQSLGVPPPQIAKPKVDLATSIGEAIAAIAGRGHGLLPAVVAGSTNAQAEANRTNANAQNAFEVRRAAVEEHKKFLEGELAQSGRQQFDEHLERMRTQAQASHDSVLAHHDLAMEELRQKGLDETARRDDANIKRYHSVQIQADTKARYAALAMEVGKGDGIVTPQQRQIADEQVADINKERAEVGLPPLNPLWGGATLAKQRLDKSLSDAREHVREFDTKLRQHKIDQAQHEKDFQAALKALSTRSAAGQDIQKQRLAWEEAGGSMLNRLDVTARALDDDAATLDERASDKTLGYTEHGQAVKDAAAAHKKADAAQAMLGESMSSFERQKKVLDMKPSELKGKYDAAIAKINAIRASRDPNAAGTIAKGKKAFNEQYKDAIAAGTIKGL